PPFTPFPRSDSSPRDLNQPGSFLESRGGSLSASAQADDVELLLRAALGHQGRKLSDNVEQFVKKRLAEWRTDLAIAYWQTRTAAPAERSERKTVTDRLRSQVVDQLRGRFETFLRESSGEEQRLLEDIFETWESCNSPTNRTDEILLGDAFQWALGRYKTYI